MVAMMAHVRGVTGFHLPDENGQCVVCLSSKDGLCPGFVFTGIGATRQYAAMQAAKARRMLLLQELPSAFTPPGKSTEKEPLDLGLE